MDNKKAWSTAYEVLGKKTDLSPKQIKVDGKIISSPEAMAESFNSIFSKKVRKLIKALAGNTVQNPCHRLSQWLQSRSSSIPQFELKEISQATLKKYLKKLKGNRSIGFDQIDSYSLKLAGPHLENVLLHLVNLTIRNKSYPKTWKTQLVHPFYKKGDKCEGENYRPVSHIVEVSKIIEHAAFEQVTEHFTSNSLFHPNHHGFVPNHNTTSALIHIHDLWLRAAEDKKITATLLLDLSAAFDVIDHDILLDKLRLYNFSENTINFFSSYLGCREQVVQVAAKLSSPISVGPQGVPQGSILGPLLFIIYMNDFPGNSEVGDDILYADDTTEVVADHDPDILELKIQAKANSSTQWIRDNKMLCSGDKTKLLIVCTKEIREKLKQSNKIFKINVGGKDIEETVDEKLLGIVISNNMSWSTHLYGNKKTGKEKIQGLIPQLSQRVGILKQLSKLMTNSQLRSTGAGLFTSKLLYGAQLFTNVWGICDMDDSSRRFTAFTKDDCRRLQVLQNKVLRMTVENSDRNTSTKVLLEKAKELSVHQLGAFHTLQTVFKAVTNEEPKYLFNRLKLRKPAEEGTIFPHRVLNTIQANYRMSLSRSGFIFRGSKLWNLLPSGLRTEKCPKKFKMKSKSWILENVPIKPP